jgi:hypothetical protein
MHYDGSSSARRLSKCTVRVRVRQTTVLELRDGASARSKEGRAQAPARRDEGALCLG